MAARKRTAFQREADLDRTAEMYLHGQTMREIAKVIGVSAMQICDDLKEVRKRWRERYTLKLDEKKEHELARIDALEREYYLAWEESKKDFIQTTKTISQGTKGADGKRGTETKHNQYGDPRFLAGVAWCIKARREILGLDAPAKFTITDDEHEWTDEEIDKLIAKRARLPHEKSRKGNHAAARAAKG